MYQTSSSDFCNKGHRRKKSNTGCRVFSGSESFTHLGGSASSASFKSINTSDAGSSCEEEGPENYGGCASEANGKEKGKYTCTCEPCCQCDNCPFDEDNSQHSSFDEECLEQLNSLVDEEQKLTSQIEELENRKKTCNYDKDKCEGGSKNLQKILQQMNCYLHKENKKLGCDLAKAKRDLEGCVRGPPRQGSVPPGMDHCKYTKQIKELQQQLQATCENMKMMDQTNAKLQQELAYLKEKCKKCIDEDDQCEDEDDLSDLACQIAEILKDMENCETCKTVPSALKCTVTQIKNIAELVYSRISKQCEDEGSCICSDDGSESSDDCVC